MDRPTNESDREPLPPTDLRNDPGHTAELTDFGVNLSALRRNLRLTPAERLANMVAFARFIQKHRRVSPEHDS